MYDKEARHVIEALRSGIPSRAVGQYFSESRPKLLREVNNRLEDVVNTRKSSGMVVTGKYGEGKTHLLNTVFNLAHEQNMVVSWVTLSKETPLDKLPLLYQKIMNNIYLPGRQQPGCMQELDKLTPNSSVGSEMLVYGAKHLETDKLYFLLRSYMNTEDSDERFLLQGDLEGDFCTVGTLKKIYKRIFSETARMNVSFSKTKHTGDYFTFMSHLFVQLGYAGWVILVDETELMGRLGKRTRLKAYLNMAEFLKPARMEAVFTMFALSASYIEDVIDGKHEYENLAEVYPDNQEPIRSVLETLTQAPQLLPLTREEMEEVFRRIRDFHGKAYDWHPECSVEQLMAASENCGYLLRTKIRSAIEYLDQLYQYKDAGTVRAGRVERESFEEIEIPSLREVMGDPDES